MRKLVFKSLLLVAVTTFSFTSFAVDKPAPINNFEVADSLKDISTLDVVLDNLRSGSIDQESRDKFVALGKHQLGVVRHTYGPAVEIHHMNGMLKKEVAMQKLGLYTGIPLAVGATALVAYLWKKHNEKYNMDMPLDDDED